LLHKIPPAARQARRTTKGKESLRIGEAVPNKMVLNETRCEALLQSEAILLHLVSDRDFLQGKTHRAKVKKIITGSILTWK
jgi:hypothetical protein